MNEDVQRMLFFRMKVRWFLIELWFLVDIVIRTKWSIIKERYLFFQILRKHHHSYIILLRSFIFWSKWNRISSQILSSSRASIAIIGIIVLIVKGFLLDKITTSHIWKSTKNKSKVNFAYNEKLWPSNKISRSISSKQNHMLPVWKIK